MAEFRCWEAENYEEEDARIIQASEAEWAAERFMREEWANLDYLDPFLVHVRDEQGALTSWEVWAQPDVTFNAVQLEQETGES